ncbi:ATP-binding protein [Streptomyces griseoruber]|uniref:ATPase n=1 Tax=Streptomyces griseoruber TaxID=1943 RepID=A0A117REB9_9ACTN|nr:ATP-binding protein [Streptomyces griseoruber]KUN86081.1 ATPase [Streptomyces griseoruber]
MRVNGTTDRTDAREAPCGPDPDPGEGPCRPCDVRRAVLRAVTGRCGGGGRPYDEEALSDALLVASELATNAILHGGGVTAYDVDLDGPAVRVSVSDRSDRLPVVARPLDGHGRTRTGGRGWPIVCRLARDVQVSGLPSGGKRITAVVPVY